MLRMTYFFPTPFLLSPTEIIFLFVLFSDTSVLVAGPFSVLFNNFRLPTLLFGLLFWGALFGKWGVYGEFFMFFLFNFVHPSTTAVDKPAWKK